MSLDRVLRPKSVAIVGASPDRSKFGGKVMNFLRRHSYSGRVLPINPRYEEIDGWPCYPDLASIPADTPLDAVLVAVPRQQAGEVVRECGRRGAAVAVVFTSGFAEAGGSATRCRRNCFRTPPRMAFACSDPIHSASSISPIV